MVRGERRSGAGCAWLVPALVVLLAATSCSEQPPEAPPPTVTGTDRAGPSSTVPLRRPAIPSSLADELPIDDLVDTWPMVEIGDRPCEVVAATRDQLDSALDTAGAGLVICVEGTFRSRLSLTRSGEPGEPISLVATGRGAVVPGIDVAADHVAVIGFEVRGDELGRPGIAVVGRDVLVARNEITGDATHGITCGETTAACSNVTIADNSIDGIDGTGIEVFGESNRIVGNAVSGSRRVVANDADGIRFFGAGHLLAGNLVHTIHDRGYDGEGPHTDCFQTFDNSKPPTVDVVIERNICADVDHQCLIATAEESGADGEVGRSGRLVFRDNVCANNGSQALLLQQMPAVEVSNNLFLASIGRFGVVLELGSTGATVVNNVFVGGYEAHVVDESSAADFDAEANAQAARRADLYPAGGASYVPEPASVLVDAGRPLDAGAVDLAGEPRVTDGDGDGRAIVDIGPFESLDRAQGR